MPPRRDLTIEDIRAQARDRKRRQRERDKADRHVTASRDGHVTAAVIHAHTDGHADARGSFPLVTSSPTEKRDTATGGAGGDELAEVGAVLAPFAVRGKVPSRRYLERLRLECPRVDLVAAALEAADWLSRTENHHRECNSAFLGNWVRRRTGPQQARPRSVLAGVLQQIATDPVAGPSTWR